MNKETIRNKNIASGIAIIMLLLAIPSGIWPYGYYVILRWVVTGIAIFILSVANELRRREWVWLMAGIAILFNPLIPIRLDKETWGVIDLIVAVILLVSIFKLKNYGKQ